MNTCIAFKTIVLKEIIRHVPVLYGLCGAMVHGDLGYATHIGRAKFLPNEGNRVFPVWATKVLEWTFMGYTTHTGSAKCLPGRWGWNVSSLGN